MSAVPFTRPTWKSWLRSRSNRASHVTAAMANDFLQPGKNCWRVANARRVGFVIGGEIYFRAFRESLIRATDSVFILAWDVHSRILLERSRPVHDGYPVELGAFLEAILEAKPELHIYFLEWDFSMIYVAEREWHHFSKTFRKPHPRLHFHRDSHLPMNTSHHQKVLVIDECVAFAGGLDLSTWRWDTTQHHLHDDRRRDPSGKPYQPYHDTQMAVSGEAARMLGDLFRARWENATGEVLEPAEPRSDKSCWPPCVSIDMRDVAVGVARTIALYEPQPPVREVMQLHLDVIRAARRYIYLENQYFSSCEIQEALAARLQEPNGPEIVMVLTQNTSGWKEESTMGVLRSRLLELLEEADAYDRFRVYFPQIAEEPGSPTQIYVHSKVFLIDDRIVKVGSSNLSNRSMKVDTECDLVIAFEEPHAGVTGFRDRLLCTYFGRTPEEMCERFSRTPSFIAAIDSLITERGHSLHPLVYGCENDLQRKIADSRILDPDEPLDLGFWLQETIKMDERPSVLKYITFITLGIALVLGLALLLNWGWGSVLDKETAVRYLETIQTSTWSPVILTGVFLFGGLVGLPLNLILVAAALVLGPFVAFGCGIVGAQISAIAAFGLGRWFGKPLVAKLARKDIDEMSRRIGRHGVLSVMLVRLVPIAPFIVINLLAGTSHLRFSAFNYGSLLGMLPGMLGVALLTDRLQSAVNNPGPLTFLLLAIVAALFIGMILFVRKKLRTKDAAASSQQACQT